MADPSPHDPISEVHDAVLCHGVAYLLLYRLRQVRGHDGSRLTGLDHDAHARYPEVSSTRDLSYFPDETRGSATATDPAFPGFHAQHAELVGAPKQ